MRSGTASPRAVAGETVDLDSKAILEIEDVGSDIYQEYHVWPGQAEVI